MWTTGSGSYFVNIIVPPWTLASMRVKGWRGWNMTQSFGAWRCYLSIFFKKVGKDKEKDSLELWLNTFFFSLSRHWGFWLCFVYSSLGLSKVIFLNTGHRPLPFYMLKSWELLSTGLRLLWLLGAKSIFQRVFLWPNNVFIFSVIPLGCTFCSLSRGSSVWRLSFF